MQKTIKLTDKIPRVDINHYLQANTDQSRVIIVSERDVTIIRSYLFPGVEWYTRFVRPLGGDNYETGTEEEFSEYLEAINELDYRLSGGLSMSLETALESIASAIDALAGAQSSTQLTNIVRAIATSNVCCEQQIINQGGGVIGRTTQPIGENEVPIFGTEEPLSVPGGEFPEGYEDLAEYQLDKCQVSNLVVDGVIGTLRNLGAFGVFNGTAIAALIVAAVVGIIVFPPAFIPVAAAAIGFLAVEVTLLTLAANEIEENRAEWVCAIYNADATEAAIATLADLIDALIASIGASGGAAFWVKQILLLLFNADTLNKAMYKAAHLTYPNADCSDCGSCNVLHDLHTTADVSLGSLPAVDSSWYWAETGNYLFQKVVNGTHPDNPSTFCGPMIRLDDYSFTGFNPAQGTDSVVLFDNGNNELYRGQTIPDLSLYFFRTISLSTTTDAQLTINAYTEGIG